MHFYIFLNILLIEFILKKEEQNLINNHSIFTLSLFYLLFFYI